MNIEILDSETLFVRLYIIGIKGQLATKSGELTDSFAEAQLFDSRQDAEKFGNLMAAKHQIDEPTFLLLSAIVEEI